MRLDCSPEFTQPNVLILRDVTEIKAYLTGALRFREHSEAMGFRAGDVLIIENSQGENESFRVIHNARSEDGINTECVNQEYGHSGFSHKELERLLRDGKIKAVQLNMTATAVADVLSQTDPPERDTIKILQHLESLQGEDLKDYAGFYVREQAAMQPRRGEVGLNPIDRVLSAMHAPKENPHANTLQRGPVAGDSFEAMGYVWVIVEADYHQGEIRYRKIGNGRNINDDQIDGFKELEKGVSREAVQAVTSNQATNLDEVIDWMNQLPAAA